MKKVSGKELRTEARPGDFVILDMMTTGLDRDINTLEVVSQYYEYNFPIYPYGIVKQLNEEYFTLESYNRDSYFVFNIRYVAVKSATINTDNLKSKDSLKDQYYIFGVKSATGSQFKIGDVVRLVTTSNSYLQGNLIDASNDSIVIRSFDNFTVIRRDLISEVYNEESVPPVFNRLSVIGLTMNSETLINSALQKKVMLIPKVDSQYTTPIVGILVFADQEYLEMIFANGKVVGLSRKEILGFFLL